MALSFFVFSPTQGVQPDLLVFPPLEEGRITRFQDVGRLLLAIEVLSPSTARADRVAKRTLFRTESVPDYWIVDLDARTVERSTPGDSRVEILADRLVWLPTGASEPLVVDLADFFSRVLDG